MKMSTCKKNKLKFGYVILHYIAIEDTERCIESLLKILVDDDVIIVVDNASYNGIETLKKKYSNVPQIIIIKNEKNLGFAKGNNLGFTLAKEKFKCDFIICLNNDTIINQVDFREKILRNYYCHGFAVAGPKIIQSDGNVFLGSPTVPIHTTSARVYLGIASFAIRYIASFLNLDIILECLFDKKNESNRYCNEYQEKMQIAGCCIIFSPEYICRFDGFNDSTFLYLEEVLLYIRVKKANLTISYIPDVAIIHIGQVATKMSEIKSQKYRRFRYKCHLKSFVSVLKEIKS